MVIPEKISPSPLHEAAIEVRFTPLPPPDAVFGLLYGLVKDTYPTVEKLPVLQIPDEIRSRDPNLLHVPCYRLQHHHFALQLGPRVLTLSTESYPGWNAFSTEAFRLFDSATTVFGDILRVGLRYINFFSANVFTLSNLALRFRDGPLNDLSTFIRTELPNPPFTTTLQVTNNATIAGDKPKKGSVIDLDTFVSNPDVHGDTPAVLRDLSNRAHDIAKTHFFELLTDDFIATLNPVYPGPANG